MFVGFVYFDLPFDCFYALVNDLIIGWLEIWWSLVVAMSNHINSVLFNVRSLIKLEEIQSKEVIKVLAKCVITIEINSIVQLGELQYYLNNFWLVLT